jgi:hypothetical protein
MGVILESYGANVSGLGSGGFLDKFLSLSLLRHLTGFDGTRPIIEFADFVLKTGNGLARIGRSATQIADITLTPLFVARPVVSNFPLNQIEAILFERSGSLNSVGIIGTCSRAFPDAPIPVIEIVDNISKTGNRRGGIARAFAKIADIYFTPSFVSLLVVGDFVLHQIEAILFSLGIALSIGGLEKKKRKKRQNSNFDKLIHINNSSENLVKHTLFKKEGQLFFYK